MSEETDHKIAVKPAEDKATSLVAKISEEHLHLPEKYIVEIERQKAAQKSLHDISKGYNKISKQMEKNLKKEMPLIACFKGVFKPSEEESRGDNFKELAHRTAKAIPGFYWMGKKFLGLEERPTHVLLDKTIDVVKRWQEQLRDYLYGDEGLVNGIRSLTNDIKTFGGTAYKLAKERIELEERVSVLEKEKTSLKTEADSKYGNTPLEELTPEGFELRKQLTEKEEKLQEARFKRDCVTEELTDVCNLMEGDKLIRDNMVLYHAVSQRVYEKIKKSTERKEGSIRALGDLTQSSELLQKTVQSFSKLTEFYNRLLAKASADIVIITQDAEAAIPKWLNNPEVLAEGRKMLKEAAQEFTQKQDYQVQIKEIGKLLGVSDFEKSCIAEPSTRE